MAKRKPQNRAKTDKRRAPKTAWKPGQSGNPGGRPKLTETQREAREARAAAQPAAVARLVAIIEDELSKDQDAIAAAKVILEGLEPLKLELTGKGGGPMQSEVQHGAAEAQPIDAGRLGRIAGVLIKAGVINLEALPGGDDNSGGGNGPGSRDAPSGPPSTQGTAGARPPE